MIEMSEMSDRSGEAVTRVYDLRVVVERIEGESKCGLRPGDCFELRDSYHLVIPDGRHFCPYALAAVLPLLPAKQRELAEGDWMASDQHVACPDPDERLIMRIDRLELKTFATRDLT
jgi:uncharacterized repeat protein (TIGR04076 family)